MGSMANLGAHSSSMSTTCASATCPAQAATSELTLFCLPCCATQLGQGVVKSMSLWVAPGGAGLRPPLSRGPPEISLCPPASKFSTLTSEFAPICEYYTEYCGCNTGLRQFASPEINCSAIGFD